MSRILRGSSFAVPPRAHLSTSEKLPPLRTSVERLKIAKEVWGLSESSWAAESDDVIGLARMMIPFSGNRADIAHVARICDAWNLQ